MQKIFELQQIASDNMTFRYVTETVEYHSTACSFWHH